MSDLFGRYQSQQSRSLARIDSTKYPDTNKDFESNLRRLNGFVDYISQYLQQMQKGVDQATQGPLTNARDILMNVGSLLGGGALLNDIDLGDLQYYLPAIGALFGFNNGQPFPINLFYAAEHFLLGYIVPLDSFAFVIEDLIAGWAEAFGLSPEFMESISELLEAIQSVTTDVVGLLQVLMDLLGVFGIDTTGEGLGVFGDIWHAISKLLGGIDLKIIGELSDPILDALAPWISTIADAVDQLDTLIKAFSGGVADLQGILNFTSLFTGVIDFLSPDFDPDEGWAAIIAEFFGDILNPANWGELFTELTGGIAGSNPLTDLGNFLKDQLQGQINPNRLGAIPIGAITAAAPNMVADLISAASLEGESQWLFDADVEPAGAVGSARTTFDGTLHELISERILIDVGRRIEASVKIKYSGVTASTGSPIRLSWIGWNGDAEVAGGDFAVHQPSGPALDWTTLSGLITRQDGDTWDRLSIRLTVTPGATAGTVWFASPRATKPDKLPQSFVDGLADALAAAGQTIRDAICNALGFGGTGHTDADVIHALTNIPQAAIAGLTTALSQLNAFIQQVVEGVIQAVSGIPFVGAGIADMIATLTGYKKDVATTQSQTKQFVVSSTSGVTRQPGWVSEYAISAATYPAILNSKFNVYADSIGPASAGTAHTHAIPGPTDDATAQSPWGEYGPNTSIGGFVTATEDCVFTAYQFAAYSSATPVAGDYWFEVFRENPDGSLVRIVNSDVSSFIPTSDTMVSLVWTTYRLVAARGERYLTRLRNSSTSKTLSVKGLAWAFGVPSIQWETSGATDTNKTSYTNAQKNTIINSSTTTPWFVLAANASDIPEAYTWTDDFERNELGYYWSQSVTDTGGNLVIDQGQVAYGGTTNGFQQALYIRTTATDQFRLDVDVTAVSSSATSIFCGADREGQNGMILSLNSSTVQLTSIIGGTQTVRTSVSRNGNSGKWSVTYNKTTKQYQVYFNDVVVPGLTWTDSGSVVPQGALYRYGHIQIIRASGVNGGKVANWLIQDWNP